VVEEDDGQIIVGEKAEYGLAFQIFIQPFDEPGPLTIERIRRDLPNLAMHDVVQSEIMPSSIPLIRFTTINQTLGSIPQAWFVRNGYLYQVAFYAAPEDDPKLLSMALLRAFLMTITFTQ
jgi:hypothetical protein